MPADKRLESMVFPVRKPPFADRQISEANRFHICVVAVGRRGKTADARLNVYPLQPAIVRVIGNFQSDGGTKECTECVGGGNPAVGSEVANRPRIKQTRGQIEIICIQAKDAVVFLRDFFQSRNAERVGGGEIQLHVCSFRILIQYIIPSFLGKCNGFPELKQKKTVIAVGSVLYLFVYPYEIRKILTHPERYKN